MQFYLLTLAAESAAAALRPNHDSDNCVLGPDTRLTKWQPPPPSMRGFAATDTSDAADGPERGQYLEHTGTEDWN